MNALAVLERVLPLPASDHGRLEMIRNESAKNKLQADADQVKALARFNSHRQQIHSLNALIADTSKSIDALKPIVAKAVRKIVSLREPKHNSPSLSNDADIARLLDLQKSVGLYQLALDASVLDDLPENLQLWESAKRVVEADLAFHLAASDVDCHTFALGLGPALDQPGVSMTLDKDSAPGVYATAINARLSDLEKASAEIARLKQKQLVLSGGAA